MKGMRSGSKSERIIRVPKTYIKLSKEDRKRIILEEYHPEYVSEETTTD